VSDLQGEITDLKSRVDDIETDTAKIAGILTRIGTAETKITLLEGLVGDGGEVDLTEILDAILLIKGQVAQLETDLAEIVLTPGADGKSAFDLWKEIAGNEGKTLAQFLESLKGEKGNDGNDGAKWFTGTGAPVNSNGAVGDWYLNTTSFEIFEKTAAATWTSRGIIKGANGQDGNDGEDGNDGIDGKDGAKWLQGTANPANNAGAVGDWYLNTTSFELFEKTGTTTWTTRGTIKGAAGTPGAKGDDGAPGKDGKDGIDGKGACDSAIGYDGGLGLLVIFGLLLAGAVVIILKRRTVKN